MEVKISGTPEEISILHHSILSQTEKNTLLRNKAIEVISKFVEDFNLNDEDIEKSLRTLRDKAI